MSGHATGHHSRADSLATHGGFGQGAQNRIGLRDATVYIGDYEHERTIVITVRVENMPDIYATAVIHVVNDGQY